MTDNYAYDHPGQNQDYLRATDLYSPDYDPNPATISPDTQPTKLQDIKKWTGVSLNQKIALYKKLKAKNKLADKHGESASDEATTTTDKLVETTDKYLKILTNSQGINNYLFNSKIKHITLNYGYQAASYFDISRDLLKLNLYSLLVMLFVIVPQILVQAWESQKCTGAGVISGVSCLEDTGEVFWQNFWNFQPGEISKFVSSPKI